MKITFLEGQYELARKTIEETPECGMMPVREMNRKIFDDYRTFALRRTVKRVYEHSRWYRTAMETAGIRPE